MARAPLSIIIPTLDAASTLPSCLSSLTPGLSAGLIREVVVADGGSADQTLACADAAGCRIVSTPAGRGRQLRAGAQAASGDWLLFFHADTRLSPDWAEMVANHMDRARDKAAAFELTFDSAAPEARWLERRVALRVKWLALPYGDQGLLVPRALYDALGGYSDAPLMEDVDLVRRIGRGRLAILPSKAVTSAAKYERDGWRKRAWRNAWLLARYFLGATPERLAKDYD